MSKQQTATNWLFQQLWDTPKDKLNWYALLKQAKDLEKEQIEEAHRNGAAKFAIKNYTSGEEYYNENYEV